MKTDTEVSITEIAVKRTAKLLNQYCKGFNDCLRCVFYKEDNPCALGGFAPDDWNI